MARYYRKRGRSYGRSRTSSKNMRSIKRRRSSYAQQRQLASLQRQVRANKRAVQGNRTRAQWTMNLEGSEAPNLTHMELADGQFYVNALVRPGGWVPLFQTIGTRSALPQGQGTGVMPTQIRLNSINLDLIFTPKNSLVALTPRIVRVWVLKLKPETAQQTLVATGGMSTIGLNAVASPDNDNYGKFVYTTTLNNVEVEGDGLYTQVRFNPACFDIKAYREFTVANIMEETAVTDENEAVTGSISQVLRRTKMHVKCGNALIKSAQGGFRGLNELEIEPLDRYYLCVHVGGFAGDGDNQLEMNSNIMVNTTVTQ